MGCSLLFSANMARLLPYLVTTRWHTSLKETNFHQISYSRVNFSSMMYYSPWKEDVVDLTAAIWMVHVINFNSSQPVHEKNTAFRSNFACAAALPSLLAVNSLIGQCGWVSPSDRGKEGRPINGIIPKKVSANHKRLLNYIISKAAPISAVLSVESCFIGDVPSKEQLIDDKGVVQNDGNPDKLISYIRLRICATSIIIIIICS